MKKLAITFVIIMLLTLGISGCFEEDKEIKNGLTNSQLIDKIIISTDKFGYKQGELVKVTIRNENNEDVKIYCPMVCALGNFPTIVEKYDSGKWSEDFITCPSLEPLLENWGERDNDYIYHILHRNSSFMINMSRFYEGDNITKDELLRITYYLNNKDTPIYSNNFTIKPGEGIKVTTDKEEYNLTENINITLKNDLSESIFSHIGSDMPVFSIDRVVKKTAAGWKTLYAQCQPPHCIWDLDQPSETKSGVSVTFKWDTIIYEDGSNNYSQLEPGEYYIIINYQIRRNNVSDDWLWQQAFSDNFIVKNSSILTMDFSSSECGVFSFDESDTGINETTWIDDTTLNVKANVLINCGEEIINGSYQLVDDTITLYYNSPECVEECMDCMCGVILYYNFTNLDKKDYQFELERIV